MSSSSAIRDPLQDHLLTPQNAALVIIDYQPIQVMSVASMDRRMLVSNIVAVVRTAKLFGLPVVLSTVNVKTGINQPTIPEIRKLLPGVEPVDRTSMNSWEDPAFVAAVKATGRKKLIMAALWTEVCLAFPALDALREGFDVYAIVDAVGGTSVESHRAGLERIMQAGAHPVSWVQLICEMQRDWSRKQTSEMFAEILFSKPAHTSDG
jgi:nicotinamidase-related amidase